MAGVTSDGVLGGIGPIAYGCWRFAGTDVATAREKIETALEVGMKLIDTADIYGYDGSAPAPGGGFGDAEELLGRVLADNAGLGRPHGARHQGRDHSPGPLRLVTHLPPRCVRGLACGGYRSTRSTCTRSTAPTCSPTRPTSLASLDEFVSSGKVRAIGVSNFDVAQTRALQAHLDTPLAIDSARVLTARPRPDHRRHVRPRDGDRPGPAGVEPAGRRTARLSRHRATNERPTLPRCAINSQPSTA